MTRNIIDYYLNDYNEAERHIDPFGAIQNLRTKELIGRYLQKDGMSILDVGGATGVYAFYLADLGHRVSLIDIAPNHIQQAIEINSKRTNKLENIVLSDAHTFKSKAEYDIIILHGPLYHTVERENRVNVLRRMKRHLSSTGVILGFAVNRFAGYFYGVRSGEILNRAYRTFIQEEIKTGIRKKAPGWYFHKPAELQAEYEEAGLNVTAVKSVVTQIWMLPEIETKINNPESIKDILDLAKAFEDHVEIGQDILCVGEKA